ncbi:MAG: transcription-repair coupling factor, partial [Oscillospiraceae bacterium]|nr:transcription-repair coupling factor [Oscillospiraceae bacterium]
MLALCKALRDMPELDKLLRSAGDGGLPAALSGVSHAHKAHIIAAIRRFTGKNVLILCPDESEAQRMAADVAALAEQEVRLLPARVNNFYSVDASSHEWEHARLSALHLMASARAGVVCATADAVMQRTLPPSALLRAARAVRAGASDGRDALIKTLVSAGYAPTHAVEAPAQFSARGGILDFYTPGAKHPARAEFFGDEIDSLFSFDPETQRRVSPLPESVILPVGEFSAFTCEDGGLHERLGKLCGAHKKNARLLETLRADMERLETGAALPAPDRYMALTHPEFVTALDYAARDAIIVLSEQSRIAQRVDNTMWQYAQDVETLLEGGLVAPSQTKWLLDAAGFWGALSGRQTLQLDSFTPGSHKIRPRALYGVTAKQLPPYGGSVETAVGDITHYHGAGFGVA